MSVVVDVTFIRDMIQPTTFHFVDPRGICTHWHNGQHIVTADGTCKCGKKFMIAEVTP